MQSPTNSSAALPSWRQRCATVCAEVRMKQGPTLAFTWCLYYLPMLLLLQTVKLSIFPSMWQFWAFTVWFLIHMGSMLNNPIKFFFHKIQATLNFRSKSRYLFLPFFRIKHSLKFHQKVFWVLISNLHCGSSKWVFGVCYPGSCANRLTLEIS